MAKEQDTDPQEGRWAGGLGQGLPSTMEVGMLLLVQNSLGKEYCSRPCVGLKLPCWAPARGGDVLGSEGQGREGGAYATEHWAKARYSRSTSRPRFSSLRNSCTHLQITAA